LFIGNLSEYSGVLCATAFTRKHLGIYGLGIQRVNTYLYTFKSGTESQTAHRSIHVSLKNLPLSPETEGLEIKQAIIYY
jgi:hypothetical protein